MVARGHAEIAGAGFAGLAAAIALRQRGWTVQVHEAHRQLRAFGAGIFLWENGLRVLKALGAYDEVMSKAHEAPANENRNNRNERIAMIRFGAERGSRMITLTRQDLFAALLRVAQGLGVDIRTGSQVVDADPAGALMTADGRRHAGDIVIGADGVRSVVRDSVGLTAERQKFPQGVIRLLVPRGPLDLGDDTSDNVVNFWSPLFRIMYVPCNPAELYLLLGAPTSNHEATAMPIRKNVWIEAFPFLENVLSRIGEDGRYDLYEVSRIASWSVGRAVILGDSAHSMPPTIGQGAGSAMANGLGLAVALDEEKDVADALQLWERRERPMTEHTQAVSVDHVLRRAGADGRDKWDDVAMRTARHVPTGTSA